VTSPDTVIALALAGRLDFDPTTDTIEAPDGTQVKLNAPSGEVLPAKGYDAGNDTFIAPPADGSNIEVIVDPNSDRLQLLEPFEAWNGNDFIFMPILMKAKGKCTTDHISAAGKWLKYRGHLENISGNLFEGAINAYSGQAGKGLDIIDREIRDFPEIAARWSFNHISWCVIGDENYGEGSSREHAAMEPRYRGCRVIFARSFARIHETNLKKQGIVPLTFEDPSIYDQIEETDVISVRGMPPVPDQPIQCLLANQKGKEIPFTALHTFSKEQVQWFKAGSALNVVRQKVTKAKK
jgi:aconitate hydratase